MREFTFRFGVFVVQFVQFFVIRCCEAAFRSDVYDQAHVVFISEPARDDITSFSQLDVMRHTRVYAYLDKGTSSPLMEFAVKS